MSYDSIWTLQWTPIEKRVDCGHGAPETAKFCPECGASLIARDAVEVYIRNAQEKDHGAFWGIRPDGSDRGAKSWGTWKVELHSLSAKFQDVLFELTCRDMEGGDSDWMEYWIGGKVQHESAVITYGKFDPKKLEDYNAKA